MASTIQKPLNPTEDHVAHCLATRLINTRTVCFKSSSVGLLFCSSVHFILLCDEQTMNCFHPDPFSSSPGTVCMRVASSISLSLFPSRRSQVCTRALFFPPFACQEKARRGLALCRCTITSHQFRPRQQACVKPAVYPRRFCPSEETSQTLPLHVDGSVPAHAPKTVSLLNKPFRSTNPSRDMTQND